MGPETRTQGGMPSDAGMMPEPADRQSISPLGSMGRAKHPFIYIASANATAVVDPTTWQLVVVATGVAPSRLGLLMENHYRDQFGRLWSESQATENGSAVAEVYVTDPVTFGNKKTIPLGQNVLNTVGLTPDGKFAVVPISTANKLNVYDTGSYKQIAAIDVGEFPNDMMVSPDGKYACEPDRDSDWLTIIDTKTWKVTRQLPMGDGSAPFMDTISPDSKLVSVQCAGYHGGKYNFATGPPAVPTGRGFSNKYIDLTNDSIVKSIPLDFEPVWDEFTPDGKYDFIWGPAAPKTVVVDVGTFEVAETIPLQSSPTPGGYLTPDPNGKYVYASIKSGLQVIDTRSLQVVEAVPTGGVVGTPYVLG
jgi:DNA-binding beta-propeller fold protein YncE